MPRNEVAERLIYRLVDHGYAEAEIRKDMQDALDFATQAERERILAILRIAFEV